VNAVALGRQAQPLHAAVVGIDLARDEAELLGAVDVIRDRRAVDVGVTREHAVRDDALVLDRAEDDPRPERAAGALQHVLERLAYLLRREDEIAPERFRIVTWR
jgi:hypothetical protein